MNSQRKHPIIVGVDGSRDGLIALAWAVDHAVRNKAPLRVVHVVDDTIPPGHLSPATLGMVEATDGTDVLEDAATEVRRL
ncbi:MAG: universal stress protein, partial [Kribbellaceae bacterium]